MEKKFTDKTGEKTEWITNIIQEPKPLYFTKDEKAPKAEAPEEDIDAEEAIKMGLLRKAETPEQIAYKKEIMSLVDRQLGEDEKKLLFARYNEEKTYDEIALEFGVTEAAIRSRENRIIRKIRKRLLDIKKIHRIEGRKLKFKGILET
jgi:RNA polymerase sigma factor (sigma-70 family)